MHPNRYVSLFIVLLASIVSTTTLADEWIELTGAGSFNGPKEDDFDRFHLHLGLRANHATDNGKLYTINYTAGDRVLDGELGDDEFKELSVGFGQRTTYKYAATTVQAGLGMTKYAHRNEDNTKFFIPVRASLIMGKKLGASCALFMNINEDKPIFGFEFGYALGNFN